jgi:hypothetical protein
MFRLERDEDETGISGTGIVAQGVVFDDGTAALRWLSEHTSTAVYASLRDVETIHGHNGKTRVVWSSDVYENAKFDCLMDASENAPFNSVGGRDKRGCMVRRERVAERDWKEYQAGYIDGARRLYGDDWQTCEFGWSPALTIGGASDSESTQGSVER